MSQFIGSGGGGGAVSSVNGEVGAVVLDAADVGAAGSSANTFTGDQEISSATPRLIFEEIDGAADEKVWDLAVAAGLFALRTRTDADGAGREVMSADRGTGVALSKLNFGNATDNPDYEFYGTKQVIAQKFFASVEFGAAFVACTGTSPGIQFQEIGGPTDQKVTRFIQDGGIFRGTIIDDTFSLERTWLEMSRSGFGITDFRLGNTTDNFPLTVVGTGGIRHGASTLLTTTAALTNGAGASAGTLSNAPAAGNPTKWIPINDNGTTRYIPAW